MAAAGWVVYWDGKMLRGENSCCWTCARPAAAAAPDVACHCCGDIWSHWFLTFQATENRVFSQVCRHARCDKPDPNPPELFSVCKGQASLVVQRTGRVILAPDIQTPVCLHLYPTVPPFMHVLFSSLLHLFSPSHMLLPAFFSPSPSPGITLHILRC